MVALGSHGGDFSYAWLRLSAVILGESLSGENTVAVNAPLVQPNSQAIQLTVINDPRYARFVSDLGIEKARQGWKCVGGSLVISLLCVPEHYLVKKWLLGALPCVETHVANECYGRTSGLSLCHGSILGMTVCRKQ
ncbi:hypothetical protein TNCV_1035221 [Trichonephila clavipes]|nr:hypothetical protein TNCV_1035221 [Trichonephila clavipes]